MISFNNKNYVCLLDFAMDFIRCKWKALLLCNLYNGPKRFLELQRLVKGISQKILNIITISLVLNLSYKFNTPM